LELPSLDKSIFPCPLNAGWELLRTIEIPQKTKSKSIVGGLSGISYDKNNDDLWLISDNVESYLLRIRDFKNFIQKLNNITINSNIEKLTLKDKSGFKPKLKIDGEAIALDKQNVLILNESRKLEEISNDNVFYNQSIMTYDLETGNLIKVIKLPQTFKYGTSGLESLTRIEDKGLIIATEGRNKHVYYKHNIVKLIERKLPYLIKESNSKSYKSARYIYIDKKLKKRGINEMKTNGKLRDILSVNGTNNILALSTKDKNSSIDLYKYKLKGNKLKISGPIFNWKINDKRKWEGITIGPTTNEGKSTILLINDNDLKQSRKNIISILTPNKSDICRSS
tara:strand:- start:216 stop:1229 length:1014 start_codon:yes stop_codon:yes gene_type:complete